MYVSQGVSLIKTMSRTPAKQYSFLSLKPETDNLQRLCKAAWISLRRCIGESYGFPIRLALDNIEWSRTEWKSWSLYFRDRNKYGGIWKRSINLFKVCSLCYCDAVYRRYFSLFAKWTIFRHIYFCHERTTMTSLRDIGKHDFRSVLLQPVILC